MYSAAAALRTVVSKPGPKPPNHALAMTPGKKVMNGMPDSSTDCSTRRASRLTRKQRIAVPYRAAADRLRSGNRGFCCNVHYAQSWPAGGTQGSVANGEGAESCGIGCPSIDQRRSEEHTS